ncbi:MAG: maleylpyruvate isomerase family mycothiol-dependent enzyme [Acidimicrobiales bacterium]|nr:maleylpyruvate isomerase family mycothiol-dependent enzyme [Acidimicrobiales bacterium]
MDATTHLAAVRRDGALLAATPADALGLTVPSCPDWTVAELLGHTAWVHRWVTATLAAPPDSPPSPKTIERAPADPGAVVAWYADALEAMLAEFDRADLAVVYKTFVGPQPGTWWARRMAHETSIHRWDAQAAQGAPEPIDPALAVDGVDEALDSYVTRRFDRESFGASGQTLHLHATDTEGEWMLTMDPDAVRWERAHGKGDTALRGPASELLLFVMSRRGTEGIEVFGDAELPRRWQAAANF